MIRPSASTSTTAGCRTGTGKKRHDRERILRDLSLNDSLVFYAFRYCLHAHSYALGECATYCGTAGRVAIPALAVIAPEKPPEIAA